MKRLALLAALALLCTVAHAQAAPALTFTLQTSTNDGKSVVPKLTWSTTPAATSCTASGATDWTGTKAAAGTVTLAAVNTSRTYALVCTWPGVTKAALTWVAPTTNMDGSALTNLAGFRILWGTSASALTQTEYLQNPALRTWTSPDLAAGTWFFAVAAFNSLGLESDLSNIVSKTTSAGATDSRSLALAIQYPSPPTGVQ